MTIQTERHALRAARTPAYLVPAPPPRQRPAKALDALAAQLRERGVTSLWRAEDDQTTWPAADPPGAAQRLAELSLVLA